MRSSVAHPMPRIKRCHPPALRACSPGGGARSFLSTRISRPHSVRPALVVLLALTRLRGRGILPHRLTASRRARAARHCETGCVMDGRIRYRTRPAGQRSIEAGDPKPDADQAGRRDRDQHQPQVPDSSIARPRVRPVRHSPVPRCSIPRCPHEVLLASMPTAMLFRAEVSLRRAPWRILNGSLVADSPR
jgi:hypothetical protein